MSRRAMNAVNNSSADSLDLWDLDDEMDSDEFDDPSSPQTSSALTLNRSGEMNRSGGSSGLHRSGDLTNNNKSLNLSGSLEAIRSPIRKNSPGLSRSPRLGSPGLSSPPRLNPRVIRSGDLTKRSLNKSSELNRSGELSLALSHDSNQMSVMNPSMNKSLEQLVMSNYHLGDDDDDDSSDSGHSLTLVDLESSNSDIKKQKGSKRDIMTTEESKGLVRGAFQVGLAVMLAPLIFLFGNCLNNKKDDGLDAVVRPPEAPANTNNPSMSASSNTHATSTTSGRMQIQREMVHQSSRQVVEESSRNIAAGFYMPQNTVTQQVLRQAAINAARSASVSAGQGASVLASSAAAGAAGAAAGTKLILVGLFFGIFAGGAGIATGVAMMNKRKDQDAVVDELKNETLNGGGKGGGGVLDGYNETGGGSGSGGLDSNGGNGGNGTQAGGAGQPPPQTDSSDGEVIPTCPNGQVLSMLDGGSLGCISAVGICEDWQAAVDGVCEDCYVGQVSVTDPASNFSTHVECASCEPGEVRSSADGEAPGPCVPATDYCQPWEQAVGGRCTACFTGQVSRIGDDGNPTHDGCSFCPDGQVRSSADGRATGPCVPAKDYCQPWQFATNGRCSDCGAGQASAVNETTMEMTYEGCEFCPDGTVRSSYDGTALGPCVPAKDYCDSWQHATNGKCTDCGTGQASAVNETTLEFTFEECAFCPEGYVRSSADGTTLGPCVAAGDFCETWQFAINGRCNNCTRGQESSRDADGEHFTYEYCSYCENGQVRSSRDGDVLGPCVSAVGICEIHEQATLGRCRTCPEGQATSIDTNFEPDHESCLFCKRGEVRSSANGLALGPCVSAKDYCEPWEYAEFGRCITCQVGQISLKDENSTSTHMACEFCARGQVRSNADGRSEGPCVPATGICAFNQRALKGQCVNCIDGEQSSTGADGNYDHLACV